MQSISVEREFIVGLVSVGHLCVTNQWELGVLTDVFVYWAVNHTDVVMKMSVNNN